MCVQWNKVRAKSSRNIEGNENVTVLEELASSNEAIMRNGAPEPSLIFIGKA